MKRKTDVVEILLVGVVGLAMVGLIAVGIAASSKPSTLSSLFMKGRK